MKMAHKQQDDPQNFGRAPSKGSKSFPSAAVTWQAHTSLTQQASSTSCQLHQDTADAGRAVSTWLQQGKVETEAHTTPILPTGGGGGQHAKRGLQHMGVSSAHLTHIVRHWI